MLAGIGAGRGRPLVEVATVAAARVAAPGRAAGRRGRTGGSSPPQPRPSASLPGKGVGEPSPEQTLESQAKTTPV